MELKENHFALFLLYQSYNDRNNKLPDFIEQGKTINVLREKKLGEHQIAKKHSHINPFKISNHGKNFSNFLNENSFFSIFSSIPLDTKEDFFEYYEIN